MDLSRLFVPQTPVLLRAQIDISTFGARKMEDSPLIGSVDLSFLSSYLT